MIYIGLFLIGMLLMIGFMTILDIVFPDTVEKMMDKTDDFLDIK